MLRQAKQVSVGAVEGSMTCRLSRKCARTLGVSLLGLTV